MFAGQMKSIGYQCAASDGWAFLFAFGVSCFISSLKDLFQQLLIEYSSCARKCSGGQEIDQRWEAPFPSLCSRGSHSSVGLRRGLDIHSSVTSHSLLNPASWPVFSLSLISGFEEGRGWLYLEESWEASLRR